MCLWGATVKGKALLLDRDGVINIDHGYVASIDRFEFRVGIFDLTRRAQDMGYRIIVITNQSGIARGYYTEQEFLALTHWMTREFAQRGTTVDAVFHCPYHRVPGGGRYARDSFWRKPNPGMILDAAMRFDLDLARSVFLGDQPTDMAAARAAAVGTRVLLSENGPDGGPDPVIRELAELMPWFIQPHP